MKKPSQYRKLSASERRERTLERAMKVFAEKGFSGTNSRSLARAAGVSEAMVYRQFGSKRGLYQAIIERKIQSVGDSIFPRQAASEENDKAVFETLARELLVEMEQDQTFLRLLLFSALEDAQLSRMFVHRRVRAVMNYLAEYIAQRQKKGKFVAADPNLVALFFIGMVAQYVLAKQVLGIDAFDGCTQKQVVETVVQLTLGGLCGPPVRGPNS